MREAPRNLSLKTPQVAFSGLKMLFRAGIGGRGTRFAVDREWGSGGLRRPGYAAKALREVPLAGG